MIALDQAPPADSLRRVLREVFTAPEYDWSTRVGALEWLRARWDALTAWVTGLEGTHPAGYYALVIALTVVLLALLAHFAYVFWRVFQPVAAQAMGQASAPAPRGPRWYLDEARRLAADGRYAEALAQRFHALVLLLAERRALAFGASKTPAEYAAEVQFDDAGRGQFTALVSALYRVAFGGALCTADEWARFDRDARALEDARASG